MSHPPLKKHTKQNNKILKRRNKIVPLEDFYDEFEFESTLISALKDARVKAGLSQAGLAKKIGVKQSAIARFESGDVNPTLIFLKKIILALGLVLAVSKTKEE